MRLGRVRTLDRCIAPEYCANKVFCLVGYSDYVSILPSHVRPHLKKQLDRDNKGVDIDLCDIAENMIKWEERLAVPLGLTEIEIYDIQKMYSSNPKLQR